MLDNGIILALGAVAALTGAVAVKDRARSASPWAEAWGSSADLFGSEAWHDEGVRGSSSRHRARDARGRFVR